MRFKLEKEEIGFKFLGFCRNCDRKIGFKELLCQDCQVEQQAVVEEDIRELKVAVKGIDEVLKGFRFELSELRRKIEALEERLTWREVREL